MAARTPHDVPAEPSMSFCWRTGLSKSFLYNRAQKCLSPCENRALGASSTLRDILFGPWTIEEQKHYRKLQAKLNRPKTK